MADVKTNKLIPILVTLVIFALVGVGFVALRSGESAPSNLTKVPKPNGDPTADSPADTVRTLTSQVKDVQEKQKAMLEENAELRSKNQELMRDHGNMESTVVDKVQQRMSNQNGGLLSSFQQQLDELKNRSAGLPVASTGVSGGSGGAASGVPNGNAYGVIGADGATRGVATISANGMPGLQGGAPTVHDAFWVEPVGSKMVVDATGKPTFVPAAFEPPTSANNAAAIKLASQLNSGGAGAGANSKLTGNPLVPGPESDGVTRDDAGRTIRRYFTVPENATLIGSTAMTALVGRIPVNGRVTDPMPFKALIGRPNLAANGLDVPNDIAGMVVSGTAVGDWGLSCVQGYISSVTFIFNDGRIKTVSDRRKANASATNTGGLNAGVAAGDAIGWISDERGTPCISGELITNAPTYLTAKIGLKALEAAASAAAAAQTTSTTNALGGGSTTVTGDVNKFVLNQTAVGGLRETGDWLNSRLNSSFDAVYVKPGARIVIHIDRELAIDKDDELRKLNYGQVNAATARASRRLD
jgi:integrating conjugative element protein (TIGR03752 family)